MKKCGLCGNEFPNLVKIDGKQRNLSNRIYCLICSPFGQHNTKALHNLSVRDKKQCNKCGETKPNLDFGKKGKGLQSYCKPCLYAYQIERWIKIKKKAIAYKGGKCIVCMYNCYYGALDFHHRDPEKKDADWSKLRLRSWDKITKELDNCDLYCNRCHSELHHKIRTES